MCLIYWVVHKQQCQIVLGPLPAKSNIILASNVLFCIWPWEVKTNIIFYLCNVFWCQLWFRVGVICFRPVWHFICFLRLLAKIACSTNWLEPYNFGQLHSTRISGIITIIKLYHSKVYQGLWAQTGDQGLVRSWTSDKRATPPRAFFNKSAMLLWELELWNNLKCEINQQPWLQIGAKHSLSK